MAAPVQERARLEELADAARAELADAQPLDVLDWAFGIFDDRLCVASSMADAVLIDLASRLRSSVPVVFLDTGYHFAETIRMLERVAARYPIQLVDVRPLQTVSEQDELFGPRLYARDPDACCNLRKVDPLRRALEPYLAWATGIRRDETEARRRVQVVEWDSNRAVVKVNPLAAWTEQDVARYVAERDVPVNPLLAAGYTSIGCEPCTHRVADGAGPRSGRWAGTGKTECGLHWDVGRTPLRD